MVEILNPRTWDPQQELPNLGGKIALVTGSNQGIGFHTVKHLALKGAKVYLGARTQSKAEAAIASLLEVSPTIKPSQVVWLPLDLSDPESIAHAAEKLKSLETKLDILVNNAAASVGASSPPTGWTAHMAIDFAGHILLTNLILPLLKNAARTPGSDVRIVNVASNVPGVFLPKNYVPNFDISHAMRDPLPYYPASWRYLGSRFFTYDMIPYSVAKLAVMLGTRELQRKLDEQGIPILVTCLHPGGVNTAASRSIFSWWFQPVLRGFLTPEQGARHSLWAAAAPEVRDREAEIKGRYLALIGKVETNHPAEENEALARTLWESTEIELNAYMAEHAIGKLLEW